LLERRGWDADARTGKEAMEATRAARMPRGRGQGGFTLLEAVVSLALVSTVVLGLAAGMLTALRSSASAKATQAVDVALSAYTESFKVICAPMDAITTTTTTPCERYPAAECPLPPDFEALVRLPEWFGTEVVVGVESTEGWDETAPTPEWVDCNAWGPRPASGIHRLTVGVTVDTAEGPETSTGQVVVRRSGL
jgi:hypothetical protein